MHSASDILQWLMAAVAKETNASVESIDPDQSVHTLGIDSALIISLTFDLEDRFEVKLDPTAIFAQPSLRAFAEALAERIASGSANPGVI